jgi:bromodomain adjacent to zinc finger domain protein 1A
MNNDASTSTKPYSQPTVDLKTLHNVMGDLKVPAKEAMANDDPAKYTYKIQIIEEEKEKSDKNKAHAKDASKSKWNGSLMDVQPSSMR